MIGGTGSGPITYYIMAPPCLLCHPYFQYHARSANAAAQLVQNLVGSPWENQSKEGILVATYLPAFAPTTEMMSEYALAYAHVKGCVLSLLTFVLPR